MNLWLKYGLIGLVLGILFTFIATISDSYSSCRDISVMRGEGYICHSFVTNILLGIVKTLIYPLAIGVILFFSPAGFDPTYSWFFLGIPIFFIYGMIIGFIVGRLRKSS